MVGAARIRRSEEGGEEVLDRLKKREMTSFLSISLSLMTGRCRDEPSYENLEEKKICLYTQILIRF